MCRRNVLDEREKKSKTQLRTGAHGDAANDAVARNFDVHPVAKRRIIVY